MQSVVDADQQSAEAMPRPKKVGRWNPFRRAKPSGHTRHPYERKHPLDWAVFVLLLLTTVATGFAAYYTHNQWLTARDTEKRQLRAYILFDRDQAHIRWGTQVTDLEMAIKNYGQTPAYIRNGAAWLGILEWPLPLFMNFSHQTDQLLPPKFIIAQGVSAVGHVKTLWPLTEAEMNEVRGDGNRKLVVYGFITYDDIFHETHTTLFCYGLMTNAHFPGFATDCNQHTDAN